MTGRRCYPSTVYVRGWGGASPALLKTGTLSPACIAGPRLAGLGGGGGRSQRPAQVGGGGHELSDRSWPCSGML